MRDAGGECACAEALQNAALAFDGLELAQADSASFSVRASASPEPAAGSATRWSCDSSSSRCWTLRANARALRSDGPRAASKGRTETLSAPPTPAAKAATVVRSRLVCGSERVIMRRLVSAWMRSGKGDAPQISRSRAQSIRMARSLAIERNWSWSTARLAPK
jgi:hypothetical protein